jgi:hypothetical protein
MSGWSAGDLAAFDGDELRIASYRDDGTLRRSIPIWFVRLGEDVFVRSAYGRDNGWYRRALASARGRVTVDGADHDVTFEIPGSEVTAPLTAAYHAKYDRYGPRIVGTVVSREAENCTLRLVPAA